MLRTLDLSRVISSSVHCQYHLFDRMTLVNTVHWKQRISGDSFDEPLWTVKAACFKRCSCFSPVMPSVSSSRSETMQENASPAASGKYQLFLSLLESRVFSKPFSTLHPGKVLRWPGRRSYASSTHAASNPSRETTQERNALFISTNISHINSSSDARKERNLRTGWE